MRTRQVTLLSVLFALLAGVFTLSSCRIDETKDIVSELRPLIKECTSLQSSPPIEIRGKVFAWDLERNYELGLHCCWKWEVYPEDILGKLWEPPYAKNDELTVFLISTQSLQSAGVYVPGSLKDNPLAPSMGTRAYVARYDICVFYWPERRLIGNHIIISNPPGAIPSWLDPAVGNPQDVYSWIKTLRTSK